jgi:signal peptidase I
MTDSLFKTTPQTADSTTPASQLGTRWRQPLLALLLTLLADGLGQIYNGELIKGLPFALVGWLLIWLGFRHLMYSFYGMYLFLGLGLAFKTYLCVDAFVVARKLQVDTTRRKAPLALRIGAATLITGAALLASSDSFSKRFLIFHAFKTPSASMCPTICEGDRFVADVRAFRRSGPRRGDVVMFLFGEESSLHIKRVVAVGGDEVSTSNGRIIVNGNPVEPPASACGTSAQATSYEASPRLVPQRVPAGRLFLVGDNMNNSYDSRYYGTVEVSRVRGKPLYLYWSRRRVRIGCAIK